MALLLTLAACHPHNLPKPASTCPFTVRATTDAGAPTCLQDRVGLKGIPGQRFYQGGHQATLKSENQHLCVVPDSSLWWSLRLDDGAVVTEHLNTTTDLIFKDGTWQPWILEEVDHGQLQTAS